MCNLRALNGKHVVLILEHIQCHHEGHEGTDTTPKLLPPSPHSPSRPRRPPPLLYFIPPPPPQVKQEVWDALLKRYGYQEVTDMLAFMHSASVIRRAVRAMRQRKWTRKLARIDPEIVDKVERLRKIQARAGGDATTATGVNTGTFLEKASHGIACTCIRQLRGETNGRRGAGPCSATHMRRALNTPHFGLQLPPPPARQPARPPHSIHAHAVDAPPSRVLLRPSLTIAPD